MKIAPQCKAWTLRAKRCRRRSIFKYPGWAMPLCQQHAHGAHEHPELLEQWVAAYQEAAKS